MHVVLCQTCVTCSLDQCSIAQSHEQTRATFIVRVSDSRIYLYEERTITGDIVFSPLLFTDLIIIHAHYEPGSTTTFFCCGFFLLIHLFLCTQIHAAKECLSFNISLCPDCGKVHFFLMFRTTLYIDSNITLTAISSLT